MCKKCSKTNHFASVCRSRAATAQVNCATQQQLEQPEQDTSIIFDTITISTCAKDHKWHETLQVGKTRVKFKLDTGAMASVLPMDIFKQACPEMRLIETSTRLPGFNNSVVRPQGTATIHTQWGNRSLPVTYFVSTEVGGPILGQDECEAFQLVQRIKHVFSTGNQESSPADATGEKRQIIDRYPELFSGLVEFREEYTILTDPNVIPEQQVPRKLPFAKLDKLKETLLDLKKKGVIQDEPGPTPWISNLVITEKKSGELRICLDPKPLNRAIIRDPFPALSNEYIHANLSGKCVFSVLDQSSAFWQVKLSEESSRLCAFHTPWGKMRFRRIPFGIRCASDVLQQRNNEIFGGIPGVYCTADDILIAADTVEKHDATLDQVLSKAKHHGVRFNSRKLQYKVNSVKYLGHIISREGISPDPEKVRAIAELPIPKNKAELRRCLGMVKFLSQYIPNESTVTEPLRRLLHDDTEWEWKEEQDIAITRIKTLLTSAPVLAPYDVTKDVSIQADASLTGLGACLFQAGRPVAYASRAMTECAQKYAQIEKELLAICYGCEKFRQYILGKKVTVQSDHKPLKMIFRKEIYLTPFVCRECYCACNLMT